MVRTVDQSRKPQNQQPQPTNTNKRQTVAVIGLGMSGCVAAHFLSQKYNVTCFEISSVPGLYAHSITDLPGAVSRLDMPLRAVSPHYYKNLYELYNYLGIELEQTNYQHTVVDLDTKEKLFSYVNICCFGLAIPLPYISLARFASALFVLIGFLQFVFLTPFLLFWNRAVLSRLSLQEYLTQYNYNTEFQHLFFYPILSTLLSCSYRQTQQYPAVLIAEFMCANATTLFTGWFRVKGAGVYGVASQLLRGLEPSQCHFNTRVLSVSTRTTSSGKTKVEVVAEHNFRNTTSNTTSWKKQQQRPPSPCSPLGGVERESQYNVATPAHNSNTNNNQFPQPMSSIEQMLSGHHQSSIVDNGQRTHTFDHVVVAVEPDVARRIVVTDSTTAEGRCINDFLNATKFFTADIIAHRDPAFISTGTSTSTSTHSDSEKKSGARESTSSASASASASSSCNNSGSDFDGGERTNSNNNNNNNTNSPVTKTNKFSITKTTSSPAQTHNNNKSFSSSSTTTTAKNILQKSSSSFKEALMKIVVGMFPYVDTPATGLTVYGNAVDAASARTFSSPAPRNASTTTANVTLLWNVPPNLQEEHDTTDTTTTSNSNDVEMKVQKQAGTPSTSSSREEGGASPSSSVSGFSEEPRKTVLFETWNPIGLPKNIVKRARMTRAVWDVKGFTFAEQFGRHAQGYGNIWFAGSYCSRGVTLLEQACTSALDVAVDFGVDIPFHVFNPQQTPVNASWWMLLISAYMNWIAFVVSGLVACVKFLFFGEWRDARRRAHRTIRNEIDHRYYKTDSKTTKVE